MKKPYRDFTSDKAFCILTIVETVHFHRKEKSYHLNIAFTIGSLNPGFLFHRCTNAL